MRFFSDRLSGRIRLDIMFWRDMLLFGTCSSIACLAIGLGLAAYDYPGWMTLFVILLPMPYSLFIWHCVWAAASSLQPFYKLILRIVSSGWLIMALVL
jgi:hypothetical protein